jgi:hypothetical protein
LQRQIERDEKSFSFNSDTDIHIVASLLKVSYYGWLTPFAHLWPRFPVLPERTSGTFIHLPVPKPNPTQSRSWYAIVDSTLLARVLTSCPASHTANGFVLLQSRIHALPAVHRASLGALLWHLSRVASSSNKNGMGSKNLAFIFAPLVFGDDGFLNSQSQVRCILFSFSSTQRVSGFRNGDPH